MRLYRIDKVIKPRGAILKKRHVLAFSDRDAIEQAAESPDCPVCDVLRDGEYVASIV